MLSPLDMDVVAVLSSYFYAIAPYAFATSNGRFGTALAQFYAVAITVSVSIPASGIAIDRWTPSTRRLRLVCGVPSAPFAYYSVKVPAI